MSQKNEAPALILTLLVTLGLIGGGLWWLTQRSGLLGGFGGSSPSPDTGTSTNEIPTTPSPTNATVSPSAPTANDFASVADIPSGLFNYGGSTTWAPIRGTVDSVIAATHPQFQLRYTDPLTGTPGSASGIRMLLDNQLAFSQSSRSLRPEEYQQAQQRGFSLREVPVAIEGIAIAVHPDLDVPGLTLSQIRDIYTGRIANWSEVGGSDLPITPYSRRIEDGGTVEFFAENVLAGDSFGSGVQFVTNTTQALREVAANPGGVYYASAPEVVGQCTTKPLPIGRQPNELVAPYQEPLVPASQCPGRRNRLNAAAFQSGQYPITRRLFVIIKQNGQADQLAGESYANLLLTNQGQDLLTEAGFVRIR